MIERWLMQSFFSTFINTPCGLWFMKASINVTFAIKHCFLFFFLYLVPCFFGVILFFQYPWLSFDKLWVPTQDSFNRQSKHSISNKTNTFMRVSKPCFASTIWVYLTHVIMLLANPKIKLESIKLNLWGYIFLYSILIWKFEK